MSSLIKASLNPIGTVKNLLNPSPPVIPMSPVLPQQKVDQAVAQSEVDARRRQQAAGGLASTVLTSGQGAPVNPVTLSQKSLLGG